VCPEVQSITEYTIGSLIKINNLGRKTRCTRDKRRVYTGFSRREFGQIRASHDYLRTNKTKIRIPQKAMITKGDWEKVQDKSHVIERLLCVVFGHFMVTIYGQTMVA